MNIKFFFVGRKTSLKDRTRLKLFINELFDKEGFNLISLSYIFCSDEYLLKLNQEFLKHNYYTDILTFDLSLEKKKKAGEIYISIDRVRENAENLNCTVRSEIHRVILHGALHLCGYKDESKTEIAKIRKTEDKYLKLYLG